MFNQEDLTTDSMVKLLWDFQPLRPSLSRNPVEIDHKCSSRYLNRAVMCCRCNVQVYLFSSEYFKHKLYRQAETYNGQAHTLICTQTDKYKTGIFIGMNSYIHFSIIKAPILKLCWLHETFSVILLSRVCTFSSHSYQMFLTISTLLILG